MLCPILLIAATPSVPSSLSIPIIFAPVFTIVIFAKILLSVDGKRFIKANRTVIAAVSITIILFALTNYVIALKLFGVSTTHWLRGAAPFMLLVAVLPFLIAFRQFKRITIMQPFYIGAGGIIHCLTVLHTYITNELWRDLKWVYINNTWQRLPDSAIVDKDVLVTKLRVTLLQPNATSIMIIMVSILAIMIIYLSNKRSFIVASSLLLSLAIFTIFTAYTRSMMLVFLVTAFMMLFLSLKCLPTKRSARKIILISALILITSIASIAVQGSQLVLANRIYSTYQAFNSYTQRENTGPEDIGFKINKSNSVDANIDSRMNETRASIRLFQKSPLVGAGLGVTYTIPREVNLRNTVSKPTAYTHNLITYTLMTSGLVGAALVGLLYLPAILHLYRQMLSCKNLRHFYIIQISFLFAMSLYSMFFAVFRLPMYNICLAAIIAVSLLDMCAKQEIIS